jgi:hypothetical protein
MKFRFESNIFKSILLLGGLGRVSSVLYGDEQYGHVAEGRFWAFHSKGISIVNPESCKVEKTIREDADGGPLPESWRDGVYMEPKNSQNEAGEGHGHILINSGVSTYDELGGGFGEVIVVSTSPSESDNPVKARVVVGPRPVHSYGVWTRDQFWTHSDGDGQFYVIELNDITQHTGKPIQAKVKVANHGKLLWDENVHLSKHGFATSTGERTVFYMDMDTHDLLGTYNYTKDITINYPRYCRGTHAIAYSSLNKHIYLECSGGGGILEMNVENPEKPEFVHQHKDATGSLYEIPDGTAVVASDKTNNKMHIFKPDGTGNKSSIQYQIKVPGHPSTPTFYPFMDSYIACMPLTENTNLNNRNEQGEIACDYYGCSGASTPEDVASGVCLYDETEGTLQEATLSEISKVQNEEEPFKGACNRCKKDINYDAQGKCICTPFCGSCADENYDASNSGVQCVNLADVFSREVSEATLIKGAGAVKQGDRYESSPACGFGRTYRTHKRGGKYDASVANYPVDSLQIVNMETQTFKCQVELMGTPGRVVYVPPQSDESSKGSVLSVGAIAGVIVGSVALILAA